MKRIGSTIAVLIAVLIAALATNASASPNESRSRAVPAASTAMRPGFERYAARLRARHIDPNDPHLHERLAELVTLEEHRKPHLAALALGSKATTTITMHAPAFAPSAYAASSHALAGTGTNGSNAFQKPAGIVGEKPKPVITKAFSYLNAGMAFVLATKPTAATATLDIGLGPCLKIHTDVPVQPFGTLAVVGTQIDAFLDKTPGTATVTIDGKTSDPIAFDYTSSKELTDPLETVVVTMNGTVDGSDPAASSDDATFSTTAPGTRKSTDPSDADRSGTDTLGYGVSLENGWVATAEIKSVHSFVDGDGYFPSDENRSATIVQQPGNGRLETRVAWKYKGGDSLSYVLVWHFKNGKNGMRYDDHLKKSSPCPGEA